MEIIELESYINKIKSVISSKVIIDNDQEIQEIHIVSTNDRSTKQISRDVQSILICQFGLDIDHKKISIAQVYENLKSNREFRLKVKAIEYLTSSTRADVKVILSKDDSDFEGTTTGPNTSSNAMRMLANATLKAVECFCGTDQNFILEDVKSTTLAGKELIMVAVTFVSDCNEQIYCGSAFEGRDVKETVVKATLDAINRSILKHHTDI